MVFDEQVREGFERDSLVALGFVLPCGSSGLEDTLGAISWLLLVAREQEETGTAIPGFRPIDINTTSG